MHVASKKICVAYL